MKKPKKKRSPTTIERGKRLAKVQRNPVLEDPRERTLRREAEARRETKQEIVYGDYKVVLESLVRAAQEEYRADKVRPGVVISLLVTGEWYVSLKRFRTGPNDGIVVISQKARTLAEAVWRLAKEWSTNRDALTNLARTLSTGPWPPEEDGSWRGDPT